MTVLQVRHATTYRSVAIGGHRLMVRSRDTGVPDDFIAMDVAVSVTPA